MFLGQWLVSIPDSEHRLIICHRTIDVVRVEHFDLMRLQCRFKHERTSGSTKLHRSVHRVFPCDTGSRPSGSTSCLQKLQLELRCIQRLCPVHEVSRVSQLQCYKPVWCRMYCICFNAIHRFFVKLIYSYCSY